MKITYKNLLGGIKMDSLFAKKIAIFSLVSGSISIYFSLPRAVMGDGLRMLIPTIIGTLPLFIFGIIIMVKSKKNNGVVKLSVIGLFIYWLFLEVSIIFLLFLITIKPLQLLFVIPYPIYPIYCGFKFIYSARNPNANFTAKEEDNN